MYTIDKDKVKQILTEEYGYKPGDAEIYLEDFPSIQDQLVDALKKWVEDRTVSDVEVEGISIKEAMKNRNYSFLSAIRDLNYLLDPNISDSQKESIRRVLKKPVTRR